MISEATSRGNIIMHFANIDDDCAPLAVAQVKFKSDDGDLAIANWCGKSEDAPFLFEL